MTDKMKYTSLVTVRPLSRYYFGSEKTFLPVDGSRENYLVRSLKMPQQTTILGMIRFAFLKNLMQNKAIEECKELKDRIGLNSFNGANSTTYGLIDSISPLFLVREESSRFAMLNLLGFDHQIYDLDTEKEQAQVWLKYESDIGRTFLTSHKRSIPKLRNYNHKKDNDLIWIDEEACKWLSEDEIFGTVDLPGNQKSYSGLSLNDAFYKQTYGCLKKGFSFAFYLDSTIEFEYPVKFKVFMGGDQSEFLVSISPGINHFEEEPEIMPDSNSFYKVVFLSDALITEQILSLAEFAVNEMIDFRNIKTNIKIANFADLDTQKSGVEVNGRPVKSCKNQLIKKGSIFYFIGDNLSSFMKEFKESENYKAFKTIGYNYYKVEKIEL